MLTETSPAGVGMSHEIDYGNLMHQAMRGLIRDVLLQVASNGLPGQHHFFITFDTTHPDVGIADWLRSRYPKEMTVVMQHWFDDLRVEDDAFSVTLNFGDSPEPLYIPFDALKTFVDPSVEFGLRFESHEEAEEEEDPRQEDPRQEDPAAAESSTPDPAPRDAEVVSLDSFRK